jgi:anti-sigma B factor antagonist
VTTSDGPIRLSAVCSLTSSSRDDATVVRLHGEFDLACAERFKEELGRYGDDDLRRLVLDLRGLTFMDSTGLRMLMTVNELARDEQFALEIVCEREGPVAWLLRETGLDRVLPVEDAGQDESAADAAA